MRSVPEANQLAMLDEAALSRLAGGGDALELAAGEVLFRQGATADAAYILTRGRLEVSTRIPGDETAAVSAILPGEIVGEFALLDDRPRSANVSATEPSALLRIPRLRFISLLADGWPPALALADGLCRLVAARIDAMLLRIEASPRYDVSSLRRPGVVGAGTGRPGAGDADLRLALTGVPRLVGLEPYSAQLAAVGTILVAPRGARIAVSDDNAGDRARLSLVLRGALRTAIVRPAGLEQIAIHGPGEMAGLVALLDGPGGPPINGNAAPLLVEAAEDVVLLAIGRESFAALRSTPSLLTFALFEAIGHQLVRDQSRVNRHVGRIEALERFNAGGGAAHV